MSHRARQRRPRAMLGWRLESHEGFAKICRLRQGDRVVFLKDNVARSNDVDVGGADRAV